MTKHTLFYYPCASFNNVQLPLLKVAALYFDRLVILDPVGARWVTIGADPHAREAVKQLRDGGILQTVTSADVLAKYADPISDAIRRDMQDQEFQALCDARGGGRWTLSLAKVPQDLQTDQTIRDLMGDFPREVARDPGQYRERAGTRASTTNTPRPARPTTNTARATAATSSTATPTSRWRWAKRS